MAIYHFSAKIISRANGSSALASAAYRSASRLHDERLGRDHDFTAKSGVIHSEVMAPEGVPEELGERESLWNAVEAAEKRKDAQLAREVEFAIPREVDKSRAIELARDFVAQEFVSNGMIADLNLHWDIGPDGQVKPHAHVMLTLRSVNERGFGAKVRDWNRTQLLEQWREAWADHANGRLEELGIQARIDHRSFKDQGIELEPQHKIGAAAARMAGEGLEADRLEEHRQIAQANGDRIIANPDIALDAITRTRATFTRRDLALFVHRHSDGLDQFQRVMNAVESTESLVRFGQDGRGEERFTSREMILVEERLFGHAERLAQSLDHSVPDRHTKAALEQAEEQGFVLSSEQRDALFHIVEGNDLSILVGYAGSGKSALLNMARQAWEASGYQVRGAALSGIAAENLESSSGIPSITIASLEHQWAQDRERLTSRDILVVDETGLVGSRQLERLLREAERQGAKVVLVGDPEQLQAIEAGAAFRSLTERQSHIEMREVRRQHEDWQRESTRQLAAGRTEEALEAYRDHHMVQVAQTRQEARANLVADWAKERNGAPDKSWIILTHTNEEVGLLNSLVREKLRQEQVLGPDISIRVEQPDLGRPEAIRRYARALLAVERMQERRRPVLPQTRQDLDNVFGREPGLVGDAAAGRAKEVMRAIRAEADVRSSPAFRADRFIARWKDLEAHRLASYRSGDLRAERSIKAAMGAMANSLERDAQVDTILRNRQRELGIPIQMGRSVGQSIITYLGIGRGRELGR